MNIGAENERNRKVGYRLRNRQDVIGIFKGRESTAYF